MMLSNATMEKELKSADVKIDDKDLKDALKPQAATTHINKSKRGGTI